MFSFSEALMFSGSIALIIAYAVTKYIFSAQENFMIFIGVVLLIYLYFLIMCILVNVKSRLFMKTRDPEDFTGSTGNVSSLETIFIAVIINLVFNIIDMVNAVLKPDFDVFYMLKMSAFFPWLSAMSNGDANVSDYAFSWQIMFTLITCLLMSVTLSKYYKARKLFNAMKYVNADEAKKLTVEGSEVVAVEEVHVKHKQKTESEKLIESLPQEDLIPTEAVFKHHMKKVSDSSVIVETETLTDKTAQGKKKICPRCGTENPVENEECAFCGGSFSAPAEAAPESTPVGEVEVSSLSEAEAVPAPILSGEKKTCPRCGTENPVENEECEFCGVSFNVETAPQPEAAEKAEEAPAPEATPSPAPILSGEKKTCPRCGTENPVENEECEFCGVSFSMEAAPQPEAAEETEAEPAPEASPSPAPILSGEKKTCPRCGTENPVENEECEFCGVSFSVETAPQPEAAEETEAVPAPEASPSPAPILSGEKKTCPRCETENPIENEECEFCGASLRD